MTHHVFAVLAYKQSPYLEECIQSLLNQTVKSEIILCTSTPNDFINRIAKKYGIPIHLNSVSNGIGADWNFAYHALNSKFITLVHQDDTYTPTYLEECLLIANKNPNCLIIFSNSGEIINSQIINFSLILLIKKILLFPFKFKRVLNHAFWKKIIVSFGNPIPCQSVFYIKDNLGDFRFVETMKTNMDWIAWITLSKKKGSFIRIPKRLTYHRIHIDSETSQTINNNNRRLEDQYVFELLWGKMISRIIMKIYTLSYFLNFSNISTSKKWN